MDLSFVRGLFLSVFFNLEVSSIFLDIINVFYFNYLMVENILCLSLIISNIEILLMSQNMVFLDECAMHI